jgi:hypothetical protein
MRAILVDWMLEVCVKLFCVQRDETDCAIDVFVLAVLLVDLSLTNDATAKVGGIPRGRLQLLGAAAMYLAMKVESAVHYDARDFVTVSDNAFQVDELVTVERNLAELRWGTAQLAHHAVHARATSNAEAARALVGCVAAMHDFAYTQYPLASLAEACLAQARGDDADDDASAVGAFVCRQRAACGGGRGLEQLCRYLDVPTAHTVATQR